MAPIGWLDVISPTSEGQDLPIFQNSLRRGTNRGPGFAIDTEIVAAAALLSAVMVIGLSTVADYGLTVDEFNADDYGPKALAWYTSGFTRSLPL